MNGKLLGKTGSFAIRGVDGVLRRSKGKVFEEYTDGRKDDIVFEIEGVGFITLPKEEIQFDS